MVGVAKMLDLGYFVVIWWQTDKKQEILHEAELQGPVYLDRTANCLIGYDIFSREVNAWAISRYAYFAQLAN